MTRVPTMQDIIDGIDDQIRRLQAARAILTAPDPEPIEADVEIPTYDDVMDDAARNGDLDQCGDRMHPTDARTPVCDRAAGHGGDHSAPAPTDQYPDARMYWRNTPTPTPPRRACDHLANSAVDSATAWHCDRPVNHTGPHRHSLPDGDQVVWYAAQGPVPAWPDRQRCPAEAQHPDQPEQVLRCERRAGHADDCQHTVSMQGDRVLWSQDGSQPRLAPPTPARLIRNGYDQTPCGQLQRFTLTGLGQTGDVIVACTLPAGHNEFHEHAVEDADGKVTVVYAWGPDGHVPTIEEQDRMLRGPYQTPGAQTPTVDRGDTAFTRGVLDGLKDGLQPRPDEGGSIDLHPIPETSPEPRAAAGTAAPAHRPQSTP